MEKSKRAPSGVAVTLEYLESNDYDMLTREEQIAQDVEVLRECEIAMKLHVEEMSK